MLSTQQMEASAFGARWLTVAKGGMVPPVVVSFPFSGVFKEARKKLECIPDAGTYQAKAKQRVSI